MAEKLSFTLILKQEMQAPPPPQKKAKYLVYRL
jgi:hypothetical protein